MNRQELSSLAARKIASRSYLQYRLFQLTQRRKVPSLQVSFQEAVTEAMKVNVTGCLFTGIFIASGASGTVKKQ